MHLVIQQDDKETQYRRAHPDRIRIYDVTQDDFRDATQRDVDLLIRAAGNWGATREAIEQLSFVTVELHKKYMVAAKGEE